MGNDSPDGPRQATGPPPDLPPSLRRLADAVHRGVERPRHIVVTGLMGSGKTTVGRQLAAALDWPFRDSDEDLTARFGRTARELAAADGIDALHALELDHLVTSLAAPEPSVIAAAASVIDEMAGRAALDAPGIHVVWLRVDPAEAARRARRGSHRPEHEAIRDQARRRDPWFAAVADTTVDTGGSVPTAHLPLG